MLLLRFWLLLFVSALLFAEFADGQVNPGAPSFGAYDQHEYDTVNLQNLNVLLNMPMYSKSGAFPLRAVLGGAAPYVYLGGTGGKTITPAIAQTESFNAQSPFTVNVNGVLGPFFATQALPSSSSQVTCPSGDGTGTATKYSGWFVQLADGTQHLLPSTDVSYAGNSCSGGFTDTTIDGSGFTISVTGLTVNSIYTSGGTLLNPSCNQNGLSAECITDSNGNTISWSASSDEWIDTLGLFALSAQSGSSWAWFDVNGNNPAVNVTYGSQTLKTSYGCTGLTDYAAAANPLPTSVSFPDSTTFQMTWEPNGSDYTGRIASFTNRATGTVSYNYNPNSLSNNGLNCTYLIPNALTRTTSDGKTTYAWKAVGNGNGYGNTTTVTDQGGNQTVYTFTGLTSTGNSAPPIVQALTEIQRYQGGCPTSINGCNGGGTLLTTDIYCYNAASGQPTNCYNAVVKMPITEVDVYHTISGMSNSSRTQTQYDKYGNVTSSALYDFGASSATQVTTITYFQTGTPCGALSTGSQINNKACEISTVLNGNKVADAKYTYDKYGNLLTTSLWNGSTWIGNTNPNVYNTNGTISTSYDLANNPTTYGYSSTNYVDCAPESCTNFPFPTSISRGGLTTSAIWNATGGVKKSDTDANGNVTNYCYTTGANCTGGTGDPFWRVLYVTDPLNNVVYKTYPTGSSPDTVNSSFTFNSSNSILNSTRTIDAFGRTANLQKQQSPTATTYDTVSTQYSWSGNYREIQGTLPCSTTSGAECSFSSATTTSLIDPLGRPHTITNGGGAVITKTYSQNDVTTALTPAPPNENAKQVQKQYDGLGRLQYSCAIGNGSTTACAQNTGSAKGVTTSYSYASAAGSSTITTTRGVQSRTKTVDALGRTTYSSTPEGGSVTYVFDTDSACNLSSLGISPTSKGDMISKTDANLNKTCFGYDSLHRLTDVVVLKNGSCFPPVKRFRYDSTSNGILPTPSGFSASNPLGRMIEAWTGDCVWPTPASGYDTATDEWFGYSARGELTDLWESTSHIAGYFHGTASYAGNGAITSIGGVPGYTAVTYGLDGEGRLSSAQQGATKIVCDSSCSQNSTVYDAGGRPKVINIGGTSDNDTYTYYSTTGLMNTFAFTVGATPKTLQGTLTWNQNGSLGSVAITDGFNSSGAETCNFGTSSVAGYDDWGRLLNDNCGSVWAQTFSYDEYGNITKSGNSSWMPGYDPTTNHALSPITYDNNGNMTYDTLHNYAWYVDNKLASTDSTTCTIFGSSDGTCILYDAFGREVERGVNGVYTEVMYTPVGKTAIMTNETITNGAYFPLPGGAKLYETGGTGSSAYFWHKDWLGSARLATSLQNRTCYYDRAFAPYGESYNNLCNSTGGLDFTGSTQDSFAGLYDTPNRELSPAQGRWLSPDPAGAGWNAYAYATNPNSFIDPSGLMLCYTHCTYLPGVLYPGNGGVDFAFGDNGSGGGSYSGTVGADSGTGTTGQQPQPPQSPQPTTPQFCFCPDDITSGVLAQPINAPVLPSSSDTLASPTLADGTVVQLGYVAPGFGLNSSYTGMQYSPDAFVSYASVEYQVFDAQGNPWANATIGEDLAQTGGRCNASRRDGVEHRPQWHNV